jgi:hypothetical protein
MTPTEARYKQIRDALGLDELTTEEQEEILLDIEDMLKKGTLIRIAERMDDSTKEAFLTLTEKDASEEEMDAFLKANVPFASAALEETLEELTNDILALRK